MRTALALAAFLAALGLLAGPANAQMLAEFSADTIHITMGKTMLLRAYARNPDSQFANITAWLVTSYPADLAKFADEPGIFLSPDRRYAVIPLNPMEEKALTLVIQSTEPQTGGYLISMKSNTTLDSAAEKSQDSVRVFIDYSPSFPGMDFWGILLILGASGVAFWKIKK